MFYADWTKHDFIEALPKGGVVAEIGVAKGDISQDILAIARPRKLHLIDPWRHQPVDDGGLDPNNVADAEQEQRYRDVLARFAGPIAAGTVEVHRATSQAVAGGFPDGTFDWIFVDGSHLYEHVLADLSLYAPKLRPDGLFLGDDHVNADLHKRMRFGVVEAVRDFLRASRWHFSALARFGVFVLARDPHAPAHKAAMVELLSRVDDFVEIRDPLARDLQSVGGTLPNGKKVFYWSF
ncbi:MAG: class I SAM-dependent methyltransferase [Alphaproteobacteria bacterium]|nr:class I SAM-dependent methyltransferase [Alphaproteobacteria bacterium]